MPSMGRDWRRQFHLVIAVREPGQWWEPALQTALSEALEFLSDDNWTFEFVQNENPPPLQWLEDAGLIAVERKLGRSPLVTVLEASEATKNDD